MKQSSGHVNGKTNGAAKAKPKADWTVMIYLAGDNNLTESMVWALKDLRTGTEEVKELDLRIVAQFDPSGEGIPTQRYDFYKSHKRRNRTIQKHSNHRLKVDGDLERWRVYLEPDETNTGNPLALQDFIKWGVKEHEAEHYMVILSGHGSGTTEDFLLRDDNAADSLSIVELKEALNGALEELQKLRESGGLQYDAPKKFDILGLDACFMSMVEVCGELTDLVDIVIGAEGFEPEAGWPYHRFLQEIRDPRFKDKKNGAKALAEMNVRTYVEFYSDYDRAAGRSVDLAAIDLRKMRKEKLDSRVSELAKRLSGLLPIQAKRDNLVLAHWEAQTYKFDQFVDLYDLCERISVRFGIGEKGRAAKSVVSAAQRVMRAVENCVVSSGCAGFAYQHSHGLSIYFPWSIVSKDYQRFQNQWHKFLKKYVRETRREERKGFDTVAKTERRWTIEQRDLCKVKKAVFEAALKKDLEQPRLSKQVLRRGANRGGLKRVLGFGHRYDSSRYDSSRYDSSRYDSSRYDSSRYDSSRYSNERNRWAKNPPIGSGITFVPLEPRRRKPAGGAKRPGGSPRAYSSSTQSEGGLSRADQPLPLAAKGKD
jgi:hypothetical protein